MNFKINETTTKLRGGYYTPDNVAKFLAQWAVNQKSTTILEPSCGDGVFFHAFNKIPCVNLLLTGVEILKQEAKKASTIPSLHKKEIINDNFLKWALGTIELGRLYDFVIGNPPYIRYQYMEEGDQVYAEQIFKRYNLSFTKHTNIWVPFIIASVNLLHPGGHLAMVVPSEIIHVLYAGSLRKFLMNNCNKILLVDPKELLFESLQGTVLLMIEKAETDNLKSTFIGIRTERNNNFLNSDPSELFETAEYVECNVSADKWTKLLLGKEALKVYNYALLNPYVSIFSDVAKVDVGIVTGANKFFLVNDATVEKYGLGDYSRPMFGRSEHCPGIIYNEDVHNSNRLKGVPSNFLMFGNTPLFDMPKITQQYIKMGEKENLHERYKCSIRTPWYSVPSVYSTSIGMLKRCHHYPRLILNEINAYTTDTAYRIKVTDNNLSERDLVFNFINSLTALSAELEGRHYGGGVLELVPSEIEKLLIPTKIMKSSDLNNLDVSIKNKKEACALMADQDLIVLRSIGFSQDECITIHKAWRDIRDRRERNPRQRKYSR